MFKSGPIDPAHACNKSASLSNCCHPVLTVTMKAPRVSAIGTHKRVRTPLRRLQRRRRERMRSSMFCTIRRRRRRLLLSQRRRLRSQVFATAGPRARGVGGSGRRARAIRLRRSCRSSRESNYVGMERVGASERFQCNTRTLHAHMMHGGTDMLTQGESAQDRDTSK